MDFRWQNSLLTTNSTMRRFDSVCYQVGIVVDNLFVSRSS
jgi:hypothetical protein